MYACSAALNEAINLRQHSVPHHRTGRSKHGLTAMLEGRYRYRYNTALLKAHEIGVRCMA